MTVIEDLWVTYPHEKTIVYTSLFAFVSCEWYIFFKDKYCSSTVNGVLGHACASFTVFHCGSCCWSVSGTASPVPPQSAETQEATATAATQNALAAEAFPEQENVNIVFIGHVGMSILQCSTHAVLRCWVGVQAGENSFFSLFLLSESGCMRWNIFDTSCSIVLLLSECEWRFLCPNPLAGGLLLWFAYLGSDGVSFVLFHIILLQGPCLRQFSLPATESFSFSLFFFCVFMVMQCCFHLGYLWKYKEQSDAGCQPVLCMMHCVCFQGVLFLSICSRCWQVYHWWPVAVRCSGPSLRLFSFLSACVGCIINAWWRLHWNDVLYRCIEIMLPLLPWDSTNRIACISELQCTWHNYVHHSWSLACFSYIFCENAH